MVVENKSANLSSVETKHGGPNVISGGRNYFAMRGSRDTIIRASV